MLWRSIWITVGIVLGIALGGWRWRDADPAPYQTTRMGFVRTALSMAPDSDALILGDSISESTWLDGACGFTFNASVGGASVADVARLAPYAIAQTKPETIVLEVGTNDLWNRPINYAFKRDYLALVRSLPGRRLLVGVAVHPEGNRYIQQVAKQTGSIYVPPVTDKLTIDGAHPTPEGAREYRNRLLAQCRQ